MPPIDAFKSAQRIGNYEIISKIAEGGMGTVFKGKFLDSDQLVAIKIIPAATAKNPVLLKRFEQEFRAASQIDHPNVVKAIEYNDSGPNPFLVMEFVDGESIGQRIERDGAMEEQEAIRLIAQACQGLHRAHKQGLIHRDVKPDNIMITKDGQAKLTDLGLVKDVEGELNLTRTGRGLGTPHFMAPEQFRNAKNVDVRSDIYSLGATLYMMVTSEIPFNKCGPLDCWMKKVHNDFPPPRQLVKSLSERIDWAIRRAMSGNPDQRPNSCREFVEDLMGHSIRAPANPAETFQGVDNWYLVYQDENKQMHTVKGSTDAIRRALKEGLLGDASNIRACRSKAGPFQSLRNYPEFRDLIIEPEPLPPPPSPSGRMTPPNSSTSGRLQQPGMQSSAGGGRPPAASAPVDPESIDFNIPNAVGPGASRRGLSGPMAPTAQPPSNIQPSGTLRIAVPGAGPASPYDPTTALTAFQQPIQTATAARSGPMARPPIFNLPPEPPPGRFDLKTLLLLLLVAIGTAILVVLLMPNLLK